MSSNGTFSRRRRLVKCMHNKFCACVMAKTAAKHSGRVELTCACFSWPLYNWMEPRRGHDLGLKPRTIGERTHPKVL
eukprot:6173445-Pleurochrysis_carterae.AAC.3